MKTLITGGHGFLGSYLRRLLPHADAPTHEELDLLKDPIPPYDLIFHLAAYCGGIGRNQAEPARMFKDNLEMGVRLIEQVGVDTKLILVGTTCSYPDVPPTYPFREDDFWDGYPQVTNSPYGIAKKALWTYAKACGVKFLMALPANLYGPGCDDDHCIPDIVRKLKGDFVTLWGDGTPEREFLYAEDCAAALVFMAENAPDSWWDGELVNIGSGETVSIAELVDMLSYLTGFNGEVSWDDTKPNGQMRRQLDTSKLSALGWTAKTPLGEGLKKTIGLS